MQLNTKLKFYVDNFITIVSKSIIHILYLSESFERKGLKNVSRFMKAVAFSKQTLIMKLLRSLKFYDETPESLKAIFDDYYNETNGYIQQIVEISQKENLAGCVQTMYFHQQTSVKQDQELEKIFSLIQSTRDAIYQQIFVCPLCGLVMTEDVERCPLCGANKAIFRAF